MNESENKNGAQNSPDEKLLELGVPKEKLKERPKRKRSAAAIAMETFGKEKTAPENEAPAPEPEVEQEEAPAPNYDEYIAVLIKDCAVFSEMEPEFEAEAEFQNPRFVYLTSPAVGLTVAEAFYAIHGAELRQRETLRERAAIEYSAKETARRIAAAKESRKLRPTEGALTQSASLSAFDYAHASREQREAFKNRIRLAAASGEKIFPER